MMNTEEAPTLAELDAEEAEEAAELGCTVSEMRLAAMNGWTVERLRHELTRPCTDAERAAADDPF